MKIRKGTLIAIFAIFQLCSTFAQSITGFSILKERNKLPHFSQMLKRGGPVTIAYFGGSITEAAGYRVKTEQYFKSAYPECSFTAINAGVGGTGASLGAFRLAEEVLAHKPDLVFVEFAVNDAASDSLLVGNSMEGIVRQIKKQNANTDICFLYTIHEPMTESYTKGELYRSIRFMEVVADHYKLPSINLGPDIMSAIQEGKLVFHGKKEDDPAKVFTYDGTHPTDIGHDYYTNTIITAFGKLQGGKPSRSIPKPLYAGNFESTHLISPAMLSGAKQWKRPGTEPYLKGFEKAYPELIYTTGTQDSVTIRFSGTYIGFCDIIGPSAAPAVLVTIDGKEETRPRFDSYGYFYRRSYCLIGPLADGAHTVTFKKAPLRVDKRKMVGPHETKYPDDYNEDRFFLGKVMVIGKLDK